MNKLYFVLNFGSQSNGGRENNVYNVGEKEQWCLSTLGYVKAFSRQYASEVRTVDGASILFLTFFVVFWHIHIPMHTP